MVDNFVSDYLSLLDERLARLWILLSGSDDESAVVSLLSLETTSAMIGAHQVVRTAHDVRTAVETRQREAAQRAFAELQLAVAAAQESLAGQGFSALPQRRPVGG